MRRRPTPQPPALVPACRASLAFAISAARGEWEGEPDQSPLPSGRGLGVGSYRRSEVRISSVSRPWSVALRYTFSPPAYSLTYALMTFCSSFASNRVRSNTFRLANLASRRSVMRARCRLSGSWAVEPDAVGEARVVPEAESGAIGRGGGVVTSPLPGARGAVGTGAGTVLIVPCEVEPVADRPGNAPLTSFGAETGTGIVVWRR